MAEPKTREELEAEWWEGWRRGDYSWDGLKERGIGGDYGSFESKGPHDEVTLQDYWRRDPKTGAIRSDEEMLEVGELCRDGDDRKKLWHIAHVPLYWKSKQPGKKAWIAAQRMKLYKILQLRLKDTEVSRDGVDGRAQLSGIVLDALPLLATSSDDGGSLKTARVSCKNAWFHNLDAEEYRFSEDADFSDAFVLGFADFREAYFEKKFIANSALFCGWSSFENSIFQENVELKNAVFLEMVDFEKSNVMADINFFRSTFGGRGNFEDVIFARFAEFSFATFHREAYFTNSQFQGPVDLVKTRFAKESFFDNAEFLLGTRFFQTKFEESANFNEAKISQNISFSSGIFSKGASFRRIKTWGHDPKLWSRAFFDVQASGTLSFDGSPLPPLGAFHGLKLESGALLSFDDPGIKATLASFNEQLSRIKDTKENASGSKEKMPPDQANRLLDDLAGGCRVLKKYFESQGDRERSQRFFRLELEARMKSDEVSRFEKWIFAGYRMFSDYGASIGRPLLGLFVAFVGFGLFYWAIAALWFVPTAVFDRKLFVGSFDFSLRQTFPFITTDMKGENIDISMRKVLLGEGDRWQNLLLRCVTVLQTTFSLAMIFLSGLAIRRRFKMD
jgi:hypothetical protein